MAPMTYIGCYRVIHGCGKGQGATGGAGAMTARL